MSSSIETWFQSLSSIAEQLKQIDPNPTRTDWLHQRDELDRLQAALGLVLQGHEEALAQLAGEEQRSIRTTAAQVGCAAAALLHGSGRPREAQAAVPGLRALAEGTTEEPIAAALAQVPDDVARLSWAWWLLRRKEQREAKRVAEGLQRSAVAAVAEEARTIVQAPTPMSRPPVLFTFNGCGVRVYGNRDPQPNGSYITTRHLTLLWFPLLPIDAFRVVPAEEENAYYFLGKVPLGPVARVWRLAVVAGVLLLVGWSLISGYLGSPGYRLSRAHKAVVAAEQSAKTDAERALVITRYEQLINDYAGVGGQPVEAAAEAVVRLSCAGLPRPFDLDALDRGRQVARRFLSLPAAARAGRGTSLLLAQLETWATALGDRTEADLEGALRLLDDATGLAATAEERARVERRKVELRRKLAERLAPEWPLEALRCYVAMGADAAALRAAGKLLTALPGGTLWLEVEPALATWNGSRLLANLPELEGVASMAQARVADAKTIAAAPERARLLEGADGEALRAALEATAGDQEVAATLAELQRHNGQTRAALATLEQLGKPGVLTRRALRALAGVHADLDQLERAEALLERQLASRLPEYEAAARAYTEAVTHRRQQLIAKARAGALPAHLASQLRTMPEDERRKALFTWLGKQLEDDPHLKRLQEKQLRYLDVVPAALSLGMIKLRRANKASGPTRKRLLDGAERAFLAIQSAAEGVPSFHLGLGQVYHRLGKAKEGDQELSAVLAQKKPELDLAVAEVYRGLGLVARAKPIAKQVYDSGAEQTQAAVLLALLAHERAERERWFRAADQKDPFVQSNLLELEADRLYEEGKLDAAARKYAAVAEQHTKMAARSAAGANNAAIAMGKRYSCTGDLRDVDRALSYYDGALRLHPDSALIVENFAGTLEHRLMLGVLGRWLKAQPLALSRSDATTLLALMSDGALRDELRQAVKQEPRLRRILEISQQGEVLSPGRSDPYDRQREWLRRLEDADGLRKLKARVERVRSFDTSDEDQQRADWIAGKLDGQIKDSSAKRQRRLDDLLAATRRGAHKPTLAAVHLLRAASLLQSTYLDPRPETAARAVAALEEADRLWPQSGARSELAYALTTQAMLAAPEVSSLWKRDGRRLHTTAFMYRLMTQNEQAALDALRRSPLIGRAVSVARSTPPALLEPLHWMLGKLSGDQTLVQAARPRLKQEALRLSAEITARLSPKNEATQVMLSLYSAI